MLAVYWNEYLTFLSALVGLILILTVVYFIFFRPVDHIKEQALKRPESDRNQEEDHWQEASFQEFHMMENDDETADFVRDDINDHEEYIRGLYSNILDSFESEISNQQVETEDHAKEKKTKVIKDLSKVANQSNTEQENEPPQQKLDLTGVEEDDLTLLKRIIGDKKRDKDNGDFQGKFHVLYNKDEDRWYVKREGEETISKLLHTQTEGIAYATIKALENDTNIVVHDEEGKIIKYDF